MRTSAFLIALLGLFALAFAPGIASAAEQGQDLAGVLASRAALRAAAVSGPLINVTPASHDFGRVNVGSTTSSFVFTVSNTGDATLNISAVNHSGPGFSAVLGSMTIPVGGSTTLTSAYTPSGSGPQSDNITLVSNATNGNFSVLATGRANNPPVFTPALNSSYTAPAFLSFTLTANATDPEADALSWSINSTPPLPVGATFDGTNGTLSWTPGAADAGNYAVTITVTDGLASTPGSFTLQVTANNRPPVANAGGPYSGVTGVPITLNGGGSTDPDAGQTLTYAWNFGDGSTGSGVTPVHIYTHSGDFIIGLVVTDNGNPPLSSSATSTVRIVDFVPVVVVQAPSHADTLFSGSQATIGLESYTRPLTEIDPNSVVVSTTYPNAGTVSSVSLASRRGFLIGDVNGNLFYDLDYYFKWKILRPLVSNVPNGTRITLVFSAVTFGDHLPVRGTISLIKQNGGPTAAGIHDIVAVSSTATQNPFRQETAIRYTVPGAGPVAIRVFSVYGQLVRTLRQEGGNPGTYEVRWDGKDNQGRPAPSGIYFVNVQQGFMHSTTRLVLTR